MGVIDDAAEWLLVLFVYEPVAAAIFSALREPLEASLNVIYTGNGGLIWLILWLISGGVLPVLLAIGDRVSP